MRSSRSACALSASAFSNTLGRPTPPLWHIGLFGLFPFLLLLIVLAGGLGLADFLEGTIDHASSESSRYVPLQIEPVVGRGREQIQPLEGMIEHAQRPIQQ